MREAVCAYLVAVSALGLSTILLGSCSCYLGAKLNETAEAYLHYMKRISHDDCIAGIRFQAADSLVTAETPLDCQDGNDKLANDLAGRFTICYTHSEPSKDVLVIEPDITDISGLFPLPLRKCSPIRYKDALRCKSVFFWVMVAFICTLVTPILVGIIVGSLNRCKRHLHRRQTIFPDSSIELNLETV